MKTAISIRTSVFLEAEEYARRKGISRSELYTTAVAAYLQREQAVTSQLDEVYAEEDSSLDSELHAMQLHSIKESPREAG